MVVSFRDTLPPLHTHDGRDCSRILRTNGNHTHNRLHSRNTLVRIRKRMPDTYINFSVYHVCLFFSLQYLLSAGTPFLQHRCWSRRHCFCCHLTSHSLCLHVHFHLLDTFPLASQLLLHSHQLGFFPVQRQFGLEKSCQARRQINRYPTTILPFRRSTTLPVSWR